MAPPRPAPAPAAGTLHGSQRQEMPNFDYVRLLAAVSVIFSHSFIIAQGNDRAEPLVRLLGRGEIIGGYAVCVFFIVSGFLVTKSAVERGSLLDFAAARLLRIVPGLFVCQLLSALVLGTLFTTVARGTFLAEFGWLKYAVQFTLDPGSTWQVDTVRFYADPLVNNGDGMNGALWTIEQELYCYALIGLLLVTRLLRWQTCLVVVALTLPYLVPWNRNDAEFIMRAIHWSVTDSRIYNFLWVAPSFFAGAAIYFAWARQRALPAWPLALCAADFAWAAANYRHGAIYDHFAFYAAYPVLRFATATRYRLPSLRKFGDISYGLYLYGWPMQQTVRAVFGAGVAWSTVFLLATLMAGICGYLSWHLVERPALALKNRLRLPARGGRAAARDGLARQAPAG